MQHHGLLCSLSFSNSWLNLHSVQQDNISLLAFPTWQPQHSSWDTRVRMGPCLAHPSLLGMRILQTGSLPASSALRETILIVTENCKVLYIYLFSKSSSTSMWLSIVNDTPDGEQLCAVVYMRLHDDHRCAQKACMVQNYPLLLSGIFKITKNQKISLKKNSNRLFSEKKKKKKEENYHRWWWQMWEPRIPGKIWSIFDYWCVCFCGIDSSTSTKLFQ